MDRAIAYHLQSPELKTEDDSKINTQPRKLMFAQFSTYKNALKKKKKEGILHGEDLKENTNGKEKEKQDPSVPNDNTSSWMYQVTGQWVICFCLLSSFLRRDAIKILIWSDIKGTFSS